MVLVALCLWLLCAPNGVVRYYQLRQGIEAVKSETTSLEEQNGKLVEEVRRLKIDPVYLEDLAREEYGMIKKNEMVFDFSRRKKRH